jgi:hypothetical protein
VSLPVKEDWRWGVGFHISAENPEETCMGCGGSKAFDLDPTLGYGPEERLFVVWDGNWISRPVKY